MKTTLSTFVLLFALAVPALAQGREPSPPPAAEAAADKGKTAKWSDAGRQALAAAKELSGRSRGLRGPDRARALEAAATAYDKVAADFGAEPSLAAVAAITAAELWRQQGSLPLAEKGYLLAARLDGPRYAQRALLGAADMQRRQQRSEDAMATYAKVVALDPASSRAQDARLWQARMLQTAERLDDAILAFQAALESADPGSETIEACNFLALAWIQKGDLDAAGRAIEHAEHAVGTMGDEDPIVVERLKKSLEGHGGEEGAAARARQADAGRQGRRRARAGARRQVRLRLAPRGRIAGMKRASFVLGVLLGACAIPETIESLDDRSPPPEFGRPRWVRVPAQAGAWIGGIVGGAVSIVLLPVTWPLSRIADDGLGEHASSEFMLFPAMVGASLGHALLGTPPDLVDYFGRRVWGDSSPPITDYEYVPMQQPARPDAAKQ